jgi:lipopolysaccharide/colanic/teichoic acid biosynthesis glycosyltransferase
MLPDVIVGTAAAAFAYHHFAYPVLLAQLAKRKSGDALTAPRAHRDWPSVTLIVPAHNEQAVIAAKIRNIADLDYPRDRLSVIIACDGCTDATVAIARQVALEVGDRMQLRIHEYARNIGKVAVLNEQIAACTTSIVALSDTSATMNADALKRAAAHFDAANVGVVCPTYRLAEAGSEGERAYWDYQVRVKIAEAKVGAPMGAHGAFYLFRRDLWSPLPADTINDDFILPMRIVAQGYRSIYDETIVATEIETTRPEQEYRRRVRIGAGNMQQVLRLPALARLSNPGVAFVFLSGKALRPLIPFLVIAAAVSSATAGFQGDTMHMFLIAIGLTMLGLAAFAIRHREQSMPRPVAWLGYLVEGHSASFVGAARYLAKMEGKPWSKAAAGGQVNSQAPDMANEVYLSPAVARSKRIVDIICGLGALAVLVVLFIPIALAIKLSSKGPIFYRQLRVGKATPQATHLFYLIKFRTMRVDAESKSGAVWASKNDPRITAIGRFMRKTRLDELPQAINVLKGEMSVVGPRPERPSFFNKLEDAIPFYAERTYGLRPGITGFAQVNQAYDESIEDVRNKVLYDHAYAANLTRWFDWLRMDFSIMIKTFTVMALGKGQ